MEVKNIHWTLRSLYNELHGPGYFDAQTEAIWTWTWNADPDGPAKVKIDWLSRHGGDAALAKRPSFGPFIAAPTASAPPAPTVSEVPGAPSGQTAHEYQELVDAHKAKHGRGSRKG